MLNHVAVCRGQVLLTICFLGQLVIEPSDPQDQCHYFVGQVFRRLLIQQEIQRRQSFPVRSIDIQLDPNE